MAHLSPDAPAVDFCLGAHGSGAFTVGPVLAGAGDASGIAYPQVTKYLSVPAAQYDVRIVAAGATSCATSVADFTSLPALAAGGTFTIAAEGLFAGDAGAGEAFTLRAYVDDATVASGKGALRFVHASPGTPAVDVGVESGSTFTAVFSDVAFDGFAPTSASIDANGYYATAPLSSVTIAARATGTQADALTVPGVSLAAGEIATAFAIGILGNTTTPLKVLLCDDSAPPTGLLTTCLPPTGT